MDCSLTIDWLLKDPKGLSKEEVRIIRDEIRARVQSLVESESVDCGVVPSWRLNTESSKGHCACVGTSSKWR